MSALNKFAWSGSAVLLALGMALGLMVRPVSAAVVASGGATTINLLTNEMSGTAVYTPLASNLVLTADAVAAGGIDFPLGTIVLSAPAGYEWNGAITSDVATAGTLVAATPVTYASATGAACAVALGCANMVITVTTASDEASDTLTIGGTTKPQLRPTSGLAAAAFITVNALSTSAVIGLPIGTNIALMSPTAFAAQTAVITTRVLLVSNAAGCSSTTLPPATIISDGAGPNGIGYVAGADTILGTADDTVDTVADAWPLVPVTDLVDYRPTTDGANPQYMCAVLWDSNGRPVPGAILTITSGVGYLGTGTAKTATCITAASGACGTNYRGAGTVTTTDTIVATSAALSTVGTLSVLIQTGAGATAFKQTVSAPTSLTVADHVAATSPAYGSPTIGADVVAQVVDSAGLGVNAQVVLVSVDKGFIIDNPAYATALAASCAAANAKSITINTAGTNLNARAGAPQAGSLNITYCASELDAPGKATISVQDVSTALGTVTASITTSGRPGKVEASATGAVVTVKVSDKDGNAVADGTPVRFAIGAFAGALTSLCTATTNGVATTVAALSQATGTVAVSVDWNESATASTCATAAGSQQLAAAVTVGVGAIPTSTGGGTGTLTSGSVPATGFGLIVFSGGTVAQLVTASGAGSGALYFTVAGNFLTYVPGTTIAAVNAAFLEAFPGGNVPANTAFIGRK